MRIGDLFLRVLADDKGFAADLDKSASKAGAKAGKTLGSQMSQGLKQGIGIGAGFGAVSLAAGAATAAVSTFTDAVFRGVDSLKRIEVINAQTGAALESTGSAANVTAEEVAGLAGSIERLTGVEAEAVQEGQNLLLTFTGIRNEAGEGNDIFDQTTRAMTDMAVAMNKGNGAGVDMQATAIQLGKALNDPLEGLTALRKVGVQFTEEQRDQIRVLVQAGRTMDAQKVILAELTRQFGGSAEAFGETEAGGFAKLGHAVGELEEALAENLLPVLTDAAELMLEFADAMRATGDEVADNADPMQNLANILHDLFKDETVPARTFLGTLVDGLNDVSRAVNDAGSNLGDAIVFWDGYEDAATTRMREVSREALLSAAEVRRAGSTVATGLRPGTAAFEDLGDEAVDSARTVDTSTARVIESMEDLRDFLVSDLQALIAGYYDPIQQRQELKANEAELAAQREILADDHATKEQKENARERLTDLERNTLELRVKLLEAGALSAKEQAALLADLQKKLQASKGAARLAIQGIIDKARELINLTGSGVNVTVNYGGRPGAQARAHGGPTQANRPYWVGEEGPELIVPRTSAHVIPHAESMAMAAGAGETTYNISVPVQGALPVRTISDIAGEMRRIGDMGLLPSATASPRYRVR